MDNDLYKSADYFRVKAFIPHRACSCTICPCCGGHVGCVNTNPVPWYNPNTTFTAKS